MVAGNDALRDESLQFTLKLKKAGAEDVQLTEYKYMPHGFLNYNSPFLGMKDEANLAINQAATWMQEIINS